MKKETIEIIPQVEALKDIVWYLKGYIKAKEEEYGTLELDNSHTEALTEVISYYCKQCYIYEY